MLRDQGAPVFPLGLLLIDVDDLAPQRLQVGTEGKDCALVGHV